MEEVSVSVRAHQVMKQDTFLQRRKRVDVLNVTCTTGHAFDDAIDLCLRESYEREHLGSDRPATRRDQVRWCLDLCASASNSLCQFSQCGCCEQGADVCLQALTPHSFDDRHRKQRVSSQLKEVVVASDSLELEHLRPDSREPCLDITYR